MYCVDGKKKEEKIKSIDWAIVSEEDVEGEDWSIADSKYLGATKIFGLRNAAVEMFTVIKLYVQ